MPPTEILIDINPILLQLGPFVLTVTGLSIGLALLVGLLVSAHELRTYGVSPEILAEISLWAIPLGFVGGRVFHIADNWTYYGVHPLAMIAPGGTALGGALLVGGLVTWWALRRAALDPVRFFDAVAQGLIPAMIVGGIGSLLTGDLLGKPAEIFLAVKYVNPSAFDQRGLFVYPVAAYLIGWFVVAGLILRISRRWTLPPGLCAGFVLAWFGFGEIWLGFLRSEPVDLLGLTQGQLLGGGFGVLGVAVIILRTLRHRACTLEECVTQPTR